MLGILQIFLLVFYLAVLIWGKSDGDGPVRDETSLIYLANKLLVFTVCSALYLFFNL